MFTSRARTGLAGALTAALCLPIALVGPADAAAGGSRGPALAPKVHFTMAADGSSGLTVGGAEIPNIDSVKKTIRTYYNATPSGIADKVSSPYISELTAIEAKTLASLPKVDPAAKKALVFDADDTTLWNYDFEDSVIHFNFDVAKNSDWVNRELFPAVPGMPAFVAAVQAKGYSIFGITGRGEAQEDHTVSNLINDGFTAFNNDNFYTKPAVIPDYLSSFCIATAGKCNTVEYKAGTRAHIESQGYDIVLNVGDQWSDLQGGYADKALKLPNPTYYLPSPNLPGVSEPALAPRTEFTMAPDGSSGKTVGGAGIPNIDSVKSTIRAYYGATSAGIANKSTSPYISELAGIEADNTSRLVNQCKRLVRKGGRPAIVFDADDTTLWTYDMEDGAMRFNFDPTLQNTWVTNGLFLATPGMPALVNAVGAAGCTVFGLTGRNDGQKAATLANLAAVGYTAFTPENYYTKWISGSTPPAYVDPNLDGNPATYSTIDYKASTRAHIESQGYDIVANFGDQYSDLIGGSADRSVKLPNPTYYLP